MSDKIIIIILSIIGSVTRENVYPYSNVKKTVRAAIALLTEYNGKKFHAKNISVISNDIINIDGELFQVYRPESWSRHDVKHIGNISDKKLYKAYKTTFEIITEKNAKPINKTCQFSCIGGKRNAMQVSIDILLDYIDSNKYYTGSVVKIQELKQA